MVKDKIDFDITQDRINVQKINPTIDFDLNYKFYYDETNNPRKFYIRENDFNSNCHNDFIIGGICFSDFQLDISDFMHKMYFNPNISEIKFKNIASGNFLDCLKSKRLTTYLQCLLDNNIYVHYTSVNLLYWSVVDIIDSIANAHPEIINIANGQYYFSLKNELYRLIRKDTETARIIFRDYDYPNIKPENRQAFLESLKEFCHKHMFDAEIAEGIIELLNVFNLIDKNDKLIFIEDEENHMLLKDFSNFYLKPVYMFNKSHHIFDIESTVAEKISQYKIINNSKELSNYSFEDSKQNIYIQFSDVFVGLLGKLKYFFNITDTSNIMKEISKLEGLQQKNIILFTKLLYLSEMKNRAFVENIDALYEINKMKILYNIAERHLND